MHFVLPCFGRRTILIPILYAWSIYYHCSYYTVQFERTQSKNDIAPGHTER